LIERYSTPEMAALWSQEKKFEKWLDVELAACKAWAKLGKISAKDLKKITKKASFNSARIDEIEKSVKHDVIAFLTSVSESLGPESRFVHMGLTSSDVLDTAFALQLREAAGIIISRVKALRTVLTEVLEAEEPFTKGQKGSSAMPHKRNPILSENLTGLARLVRGYAGTSLENVALWHERDISHSSVERVIGPDATTLVDFMLLRITGLLKGLVIYPKNMRRNMERSHGLVFSQRVLLKLTGKGLTREAAYALVQSNAMRVWKGGDGGVDFKTILLNDEVVGDSLTPEEIEACFDIAPYVKNVSYIFKRVFGKG